MSSLAHKDGSGAHPSQQRLLELRITWAKSGDDSPKSDQMIERKDRNIEREASTTQGVMSSINRAPVAMALLSAS